MPYIDSPGWERQWTTFPWDWDFTVSTVSEGHRVVDQKDKEDASGHGAKLTFGEVFDAGVGRMLHNLGAAHKRKFHDLGMGPGKMLIQTFLLYDSFKITMGVELAKGRYDLAERNVRTLTKAGWRGRKFIAIEFKKGEFMKIVEVTPNQIPDGGFVVGARVLAFNPFLRKNKMDIPNYLATVQSVSEDHRFYFVQYENNPSAEPTKVKSQYVFDPEEARTLEIWYGSLFDYPDGFDADMCILETDFPEDMHPTLIQGMTSTPIGCTFLTYHDLKKFDCYDWDGLRQLDVNVYDSDRYITSWSQGWRFYLWEHVDAEHTSTRDPTEEEIQNLSQGDAVIVVSKSTPTEDDDEDRVFYGIVERNRGDGLDLYVYDDSSYERERMSISYDDFVVFLSNHRHKPGDIVTAYDPRDVQDPGSRLRFQLHRCQVVAVQPDTLAYAIRYQNKAVFDNVLEAYVHKAPNPLFQPGDRVMSCYPPNAQNKNCPDRYKKFPGVIENIHPDCTYTIRFDTSPYVLEMLRPTDDSQRSYAPTPEKPIHESVREMWITRPANFILQREEALEEEIGKPLVDVDMAKAQAWTVADTCVWLEQIGLERLCPLARANSMDGTRLLQLNTQDAGHLMRDLVGAPEPADQKSDSGISDFEARHLAVNIHHLKQMIDQRTQTNSRATNDMQAQLFQFLHQQMLDDSKEG